MTDNDVVIVSAARTPFDRFGGPLKDIPSIDLGAFVIKEVLSRVKLEGDIVEEVYYGTCIPAETAQETNVPARQAILKAGLPPQTLSLTIDRACCSSLTAVGLGFYSIQAGRCQCCLAVGAENMSRVPFILPSNIRWGTRIGRITAEDVLFELGYREFNPVSVDAGEVALEMGVTREEQDRWAFRSQQHYLKAFNEGKFKIGEELMSIKLTSPKGESIIIDKDTQPRADVKLEKLAALKTVYGSPTVTPGNAPGLNTGAAAILLMKRSRAEELNLQPLATILAATAVAGLPREIAKIPAPAIQKALSLVRMTLDEMDLIEINEAFAAMPLVSSKILAGGDENKLSALRERININGGAIAIGHPVGASGARILMTLMYELRRRGRGMGVAAICGGLAQGESCVIRVD